MIVEMTKVKLYFLTSLSFQILGFRSYLWFQFQIQKKLPFLAVEILIFQVV